MRPKRIYKVYFSATDTTKKVVEELGAALAEAFGAETALHDFTLPQNRSSFPEIQPEDFVIFGLPTYAGRLPNLLLKYLETIKGNSAFAVPVVTFGNRAFDNSLIELRNLLEAHGFRTIAGAAVSCEHSFSYTLAAGRPDEKDLSEVRDFASKVHDKLLKLDPEAYNHTPVAVDGDSEAGYYQPQAGNGTKIDIRKAKPKTKDSCTKCGTCIRSCPMGSIDLQDPSLVSGVCIKCGACVKKCPVQAKYFDDEGFLYHKNELETKYSRRADNSFFV